VSGHIRVVRPCASCGVTFAPKRGQRYCSVPCRAKGQAGKPTGNRATGRGQVAAGLVRDWSPEMRARIRAQSLELGETALAEMIDKVESEGR
jgi:hypothetical protein